MIRVRLAAVQREAPDAAVACSDGLWQLHTGEPVVTEIESLRADGPITLVVDLATLTAPVVLKALEEHTGPVGTWRDLAISPEQGVLGRLSLFPPPAAMADAPPAVVRASEIRAAQAAGFPWEASIGAVPGPTGRFERLTVPTVVNGRTIDPGAAGMPVFCLRGGVLKEASICLFGADDRTGRVAASRHPHPDKESPPMPTFKERLARLTTKVGERHRAALAVRLSEMPEDGSGDAEAVAATVADQVTALETELAQAKAALAAKDAEIAALKAGGDKGNPPGGGTGSADLSAPKTAVEAVALAVGPDGKALRGFAALSWAKAKFPTLFPTNPKKA